MSKPVNLALWSTTGTKVEPSSGVKAAGWAANQKPPAQWLNWWMNAIYLWMVWLDAFESTAHTWTATQTWSGGAEIIAEDATFSGEVDIANLIATGAAVFNTTVVVTGNSTLHGVATVDSLLAALGHFTGNVQMDADLAITGTSDFADLITAIGGIITTAVSLRPGIIGNGAGTTPGGRFIADGAAGGQGASAELPAGADATARALVVFKQSGSPTVPDATFTGVVEDVYGLSQFRGPNPAYNVGLKNQVGPNNVVKAWASFVLATGAGGSATLTGGVNIFSVTFNSATGAILITFATAFSNVNYAWSLSCDALGGIVDTVVPVPVASGKQAATLTLMIGGLAAVATAAHTSALDASAWTLTAVGNQPQA